jgi:transcriptional regulator with XRE-family HTH domain
MRGNEKTTSAVKILHSRYLKNQPERETSINEERINARVAQIIYDMRQDAGLSQKQLAELIGTTQSVISRLENSDYEGHSLSMLEKISKVLKRKIYISAAETNSENIPTRHAFQLLIKSLRKKSDLSVKQFANKIGVEPISVIELENNCLHYPSPIMLYKLSNYYKIPQVKLNVLAGVTKEISQNLQMEASRFAAQSDSFAKLTEHEKKLLDEFVKFLREEYQ